MFNSVGAEWKSWSWTWLWYLSCENCSEAVGGPDFSGRQQCFHNRSTGFCAIWWVANIYGIISGESSLFLQNEQMQKKGYALTSGQVFWNKFNKMVLFPLKFCQLYLYFRSNYDFKIKDDFGAKIYLSLVCF